MTEKKKYVVVRGIAVPGVSSDEILIDKEVWEERVKRVHSSWLPQVIREEEK